MSTDNFYLDMNGETIQTFDDVLAPEPNDTDIHNNEFKGMVDGFRHGNVVVTDGEGNFYDIEPERLEVMK